MRLLGVTVVLDGFSTYEKWPFECLHCWQVWEEEYVVRHLSDGHGNDVVVWLRAGIPVQPPWSGVTCPACGSDTIKTFPNGYLARHAEIGLTPTPAASTPSPAEPASEHFIGVPPTPRRPPLMLYTLLGVSLLLFASFELFALLEHVH